MKVLGLDLGTTTLGIAYIDEHSFIHGLENFRFPVGYYKLARERVIYYVDKEGINDIVLGLPLNMDGTSGDRAKSVMRFKDDLLKDRPTLNIILIDERLSTIEAHERLKELGYNNEKRKEIIDMVSATIILENYLSRKKEGKL